MPDIADRPITSLAVNARLEAGGAELFPAELRITRLSPSTTSFHDTWQEVANAILPQDRCTRCSDGNGSWNCGGLFPAQTTHRAFAGVRL